MSPSINNNKMLDAEYGNNTVDSIVRFQSVTKGLKQDGIAGPSTCYALFK
jgi:murein L,D-transpeptidase YcbB/YkuD